MRCTPALLSPVVLFPVLALAAAPVAAQKYKWEDPPPEYTHALGGKVGTTGLGLEYSFSRSDLPMYGARINLNAGAWSRTRTVDNVLYEGSVDFSSVGFFFDGHPMRNGFRASVGLLLNRNKFKATGQPTGGTFRINGTDYAATSIDNLSGEVKFRLLSPYFGVGWGSVPTAKAGPFFSVDFGVIYQRPDVTLDVRCASSFPAADCAQLQQDVEAQRQKFKRDLFSAKSYPILTIGGGWRF